MESYFKGASNTATDKVIGGKLAEDVGGYWD